MFLIEWWESLETAVQILYCIAVPATLVLLIQTVLIFFGFENGSEGDIDGDVPDINESLELDDIDGLESLHIFTVRGIVAFFVVFGWVGIAMLGSGSGIALSLAVAALSGFAVMIGIAYLFKAIMKLRSDGSADNRNAVGTSGRVHLTIPADRSGEGKVHVMLQGAYVERNAVTDQSEPIPTGSEIIVVGVSGQTTLVVKQK